MTTQLSIENRAQLESNGFGIQFQGFDFNEVPLYVHHDVSDDKKRGGRVGTFRVIDRTELNEYETTYFARKASRGIFPWPVEECMDHKFPEITVKVNRNGSVQTQRGEPAFGCKWCRSMNGAGDGAALEAKDTPEHEPSLITESDVSPAPAPATKKYPCPLCKGGADTETGFKTHMTLKHSSSRARQRDGRRKKK